MYLKYDASIKQFIATLLVSDGTRTYYVTVYDTSAKGCLARLFSAIF